MEFTPTELVMENLSLLSNPFFDWTEEEKENFPATLQMIIDSGVKIIILGQKRCFFCGSLLGAASGETKRVTQNKGPTLIVTNLCDACWKLSGN